MEKKPKKGKKGFVAGAAGGALAAVLLLGGGLGLGGAGEGGVPALNHAAAEAPAPAATPAQEATPVPEATPTPQPEPVSIRIEARRDQYFLDGAEISLSEIEALLEREENAAFVLTDHYASARAWDALKALFTQYEIAATEE